MNTYMEARPTTNMKNGWLYRNSYDEKNWKLTPVGQDSRSSDDDDDPVMIQLWWWSSDDPALMMIQWWSNFDDDLEKKTCADEFFQENTFLVKRECWCICNFRIYWIVYFMYCTPMFLWGSIYNVIEFFHTSMFLLGE